ncbi:MAG: hydroxymethylbilane synthase [Pseudomonadota bacterium]
MQARLVIGSRGSRLALTQSHWVRRQLMAAHPHLRQHDIVIVPIRTKGDQITDRTLMELGGKGLFTQAIEDRLVDGRIDLAVHSMKDMPTRLPEGLALAGCPKREDARDMLLCAAASSIAALPEGARVGTASLRRAAQLRARRPDLEIAPLRGNVGTRLEKLRAGEVDATLLACAGLNRLNQAVPEGHPIALEDMLPAVGQGALALEIRAEDKATAALLAPLHDAATTWAVIAERAFLAALDGDCRTPLAAHAVVTGDRLSLSAEVLSVDGRQVFRAQRQGAARDAENIGAAAAQAIMVEAGDRFIAGLKGGQ